MPYCCANGCSNSNWRENKKEGITFHKFPRDMFVVWAKKLHREGWTPKKHSVLCSEHFEDNCFEEDTFHKYIGRGQDGNPIRRLKVGAVPTLHLQPYEPRKCHSRRVNRVHSCIKLEYHVCTTGPKTTHFL